MTGTFHLASPAFEPGHLIPVRHTCDGEEISPALTWTGAPEGTSSLALIVSDPDAPRGTWIHWVLYEIPAGVTELPEGAGRSAPLPDGARQGRSTGGVLGYEGPCPPGGTHRYLFTLYALDSPLGAPEGLTADALLRLLDGHILGRAETYGTYARG